MALIAAQNSIEAYLVLAPLPAVGLLLGARSWLQIRKSPDELTGQKLAAAGTALSAFFLFGGLAAALYVYATEVPDDCERITFAQMKPSEREQSARIPVPSEIMKYNGQRVFIKGYMRPGAQSLFLDSFLLVRDNGQCCFGDLSQVKYYDQIQVSLVQPLLASYSTRVFRLGGTLHVDPTAAFPGSNRPVFSLVADYLQ
jgi:hypothetical protein